MSIDCTHWDGHKIKNLEYVDELFIFFSTYSKENPIEFIIKSNDFGAIPIKGKIHINSNDENMFFIDYVRMAKHITSFTGDDIILNLSHEFTNSEYSDLKNVYDILNGDFKIAKYAIGKPVCSAKVLLSEKNIDKMKQLYEKKDCTTINISDEKSLKLKIFDTEINLPKLTRVFRNIFIKVSDKCEDDTIGNTVTLEFWPSEAFSYEVKFEKRKQARGRKK